MSSFLFRVLVGQVLVLAGPVLVLVGPVLVNITVKRYSFLTLCYYYVRRILSAIITVLIIFTPENLQVHTRCSNVITLQDMTQCCLVKLLYLTEKQDIYFNHSVAR